MFGTDPLTSHRPDGPRGGAAHDPEHRVSVGVMISVVEIKLRDVILIMKYFLASNVFLIAHPLLIISLLI